MRPAKPSKNLADYIIIGISPVFIMLLLGSLSFFLIRVLYRGNAVDSVRWVVFWFVLAVVSVSRIGIVQSTNHALIYGLALAGATWIYLVRIHPAYLLGAALLGIVWWCAHKLTWDCTLINDDEDASASGLLQAGGATGQSEAPGAVTKVSDSKKWVDVGSNDAGKYPAAVPHPPGLWVVYFSLVALPLFGVGQMLLPGDDHESQWASFCYLFIYLAAAIGLLLTTSFLGLRRYLRQRYLEMPGDIAFGWIKFGAGTGALVLVVALFLPRPGGHQTWLTLHYQIDYQLRRASEFASRINPHGKGSSRSGAKAQNSDKSSNPGASSDNRQGQNQDGQSAGAQGKPSAPEPTGPIRLNGPGFGRWLKSLLILAGVVLAGWWAVRRRDLIFLVLRSFISTLLQFFAELFQFGLLMKKSTVIQKDNAAPQRPFNAYINPFLAGKDKLWTSEQLIFYSYEALQAWACERGITLRPEQTAREFCLLLSQAFPDTALELIELSVLYGYAAYGVAMPGECSLEPVDRLWKKLLGQESAGG